MPPSRLQGSIHDVSVFVRAPGQHRMDLSTHNWDIAFLLARAQKPPPYCPPKALAWILLRSRISIIHVVIRLGFGQGATRPQPDEATAPQESAVLQSTQPHDNCQQTTLIARQHERGTPSTPDWLESQLRDRCRGALLGLAIGDALGTTLEFRPPGSFQPLTDMMGGGHFCLRKGYWTDDTSMALCLGHSLVARGGFDAHDQMQRYCDWLDNGYMSSIGNCFDVGMTVSSALRRFQKTGNPYAGARAAWTSGNGSIMRLAPIAIAFQRHPAQAIAQAIESSKTTHAAPLCLDSCGLLAAILVALLHSADKSVLEQIDYVATTEPVQRLQQGSWRHKQYAELTGSGFVIDCLEAALWCFWHTDNYADCVLAAANLGNDADTTAAVAGQLAGACYGLDAIRSDWHQALHQREAITALADQLFELSLGMPRATESAPAPCAATTP